MTLETISPDQAKAAARVLFTRYHRGQEAWFDLAWKRYADSAEEDRTRESLARVLGIRHGHLQLDLEDAMVETFAAFAAIFLIRSPIARRELMARLKRHVEQSTTSDVIADWLTKFATETLDKLSSANRVVVTRLVDGKLSRNRECECDEFEKEINSRQFDIVINEPGHMVRVNNSEGILPSEITKVAPMQRGMLWLALTHVGELLKHSEIGDLFDIEVTEPSDSSKQKDRVINKVYQYPVALREMVGKTLYRRMILGGASRANAVTKDGWSFCWARRNQNERKSELLNGMAELARWPK